MVEASQEVVKEDLRVLVSRFESHRCGFERGAGAVEGFEPGDYQRFVDAGVRHYRFADRLAMFSSVIEAPRCPTSRGRSLGSQTGCPIGVKVRLKLLPR